MKKLLCWLLVSAMLIPCAYADHYIIYKSDKFFLYLDGEWNKTESEDGVVFLNNNSGETIIIQEYPMKGYYTTYLSLFERAKYIQAAEEILKDSGYLSCNFLDIYGMTIPVVVMEYEKDGQSIWMSLSYILGNESAMIVYYYDAKQDYKVLKQRIVEIMENASAR